MTTKEILAVAIFLILALVLILIFSKGARGFLEGIFGFAEEIPIDIRTCDIIKPEERTAFEKLGYHFVCCTDRDVSYLLNVPEGESCAICSRSYTETPGACTNQ
jgi:hypothetical protein